MYDSPHQFEPLFPRSGLERLLERASLITESALELSGTAHPLTLAAIRELVRSMNSYYSNRIEGQSTTPLNIEKALKQDFSAQPEVARLQRLAVAHIEAECELEALVAAEAQPLSAGFILRAHSALYGRLCAEDRTTAEGDVVLPGEARTKDVKVGRHVPPTAVSLQRFLARFDEVYNSRRSWDYQLVAIACAHHRIAWIHPFMDGNGRATRLQTHCALWPVSKGLWSVNRGLARHRQRYFATLANADEPRRGDIDGRGNLTERGLVEWADFFLSICEDQVAFMKSMLNLDEFKKRLDVLALFRMAHNTKKVGGMRREAVLPLHYAFTSGSMTRGEFSQMTGLGERVSRSLMSYLLKQGLLVSDTAYGPVRLGLPLDSLQYLFPALYPEAVQGEVD